MNSITLYAIAGIIILAGLGLFMNAYIKGNQTLKKLSAKKKKTSWWANKNIKKVSDYCRAKWAARCEMALPELM